MALEDAHAGLREGLDCGTQPNGTLNETDRERGQGAGRGETGSVVGSPRESGLFCALKVETGVLDQAVEDIDPPFSYRSSNLEKSPKRTCTGAVGGGEENEKGKVCKSADSPLRLHMT